LAGRPTRSVKEKGSQTEIQMVEFVRALVFNYSSRAVRTIEHSKARELPAGVYRRSHYGCISVRGSRHHTPRSSSTPRVVMAARRKSHDGAF
jgi:hypothetical protein